MREAESSVEFTDPLEGVELVTLAQVRAIHEDPRHRVATGHATDYLASSLRAN